MKKIIMTGANDGLGREFAKLCIAENIEIVSLSRRKPDFPCAHIPTDLSDDSSITAAVRLIEEKYADFDALVNCAGVISIQDSEDITYNGLENLMKVNIMAPIFLISGLLKLIKTNEADILTIGSTAGTKGNPKELAYGSSKWALRGMSQSLQSALSKTKCRVMQFNPGGMNTKFFDKFSEGLVDASGFMNPADIAQIMLYALKLPKTVEISEITINRKAK